MMETPKEWKRKYMEARTQESVDLKVITMVAFNHLNSIEWVSSRESRELRITGVKSLLTRYITNRNPRTLRVLIIIN